MNNRNKSRPTRKAVKRKKKVARQLSPDELDVLAQRMATSKSKGEREALETEIIRSFYPYSPPAATTSLSPSGRLLPWLISYRDFQRYTYRAVRACETGRVIFFYYRLRGRKAKKLFAIRRHPSGKRNEYADACRAFNCGWVIRMRLEDLPPIRRASPLQR